MTSVPVLLSVNVGLPRDVPWQGKTVTPLLSGQVGYRPDPLEPPADGEVLIWSAQPASDLVLDM